MERAGFWFRLNRRFLRARVALARRLGHKGMQRAAYRQYWRALGVESYYGRVTSRFDLWFKQEHAAIIDKLNAHLGATPCMRYVEFGCGDGRLLVEMAEKLPSISEFHGVDINADVIRANREATGHNPKITFHESDMLDAVSRLEGEATLWLAYGGVFEYLTQADLQALFSEAHKPGCLIAFIEPVSDSHDLQTEENSIAYGSESSMSHNHAALLKRSGWDVKEVWESRIAGIRWIGMIAGAE